MPEPRARPAPEDASVKLHVDGAVAIITLDRPARLNALDGPMRRRLRTVLDRVSEDPSVGAVVLSGTGRAFCSGSDISTFRDTDSRGVLVEEYRPIIDRLRSMPKPVIAAVHGVAAGAGVSVALACDLVAVGAEARLDIAFIRLGLVPDAGLTSILVRHLGPFRARELIWSGGSLDAGTALAAGLATRVVPDGQEVATATRIARELADGPRAAMGAVKVLIQEALVLDDDAMFEREADMQGRLRDGSEHESRLALWQRGLRGRSSSALADPPPHKRAPESRGVS
jgi:2-(1,2-epoxy-1,2-dihydrophenyl)acetyl-CoA isomerase